MKKLFIVAISALTLGACRNANNGAEASSNVSVGNDTTSMPIPADAPIIAFERDVFDFGKIEQGEKVQHDFKFLNNGETPLIISDATATCGCTIPEIPKEPILPGKSGVIKVVFNSEGKMDLQDKVITITSNAKTRQTMVHLVGEVLAKK